MPLSARTVIEPAADDDGGRRKCGAEHHRIPRVPRPAEIRLVGDQRRQRQRNACVQQLTILLANRQRQGHERQDPHSGIRAPVEPSRGSVPPRRNLKVQRRIDRRHGSSLQPRVGPAKVIVAVLNTLPSNGHENDCHRRRCEDVLDRPRHVKSKRHGRHAREGTERGIQVPEASVESRSARSTYDHGGNCGRAKRFEVQRQRQRQRPSAVHRQAYRRNAQRLLAAEAI